MVRRTDSKAQQLRDHHLTALSLGRVAGIAAIIIGRARSKGFVGIGTVRQDMLRLLALRVSVFPPDTHVCCPIVVVAKEVLQHERELLRDRVVDLHDSTSASDAVLFLCIRQGKFTPSKTGC